MTKNKIIIACDSFKGSCTSADAGSAVKRGMTERFHSVCAESSDDIVVFSLGDGGEGTASAIASSLGYTKKLLTVSDTHGSQISAEYYVSYDNSSAVFDMASCCGIALAEKHDFDIMNASTEGVGQLIRYLAENGVIDITVCLGGSGTSDGGVGALSALGVLFFDSNGYPIKERLCPNNLGLIEYADTAPALRLLDGVKLILLYDSSIPLYGENGSVMMYSRQKGADDTNISLIESNIKHFSRVLDKSRNDLLSFSSTSEGAGAAGGLGYGLSAVGGVLMHGADKVLDILDFDRYLSSASLVITGEGKTDRQSSTGKLPSAIAKRASAFNVPVICLCGIHDADDAIYDCGITSVIQIGDMPMSAADSMSRTLSLLEKTAFDLAGLYPYIKKIL